MQLRPNVGGGIEKRPRVLMFATLAGSNRLISGTSTCFAVLVIDYGVANARSVFLPRRVEEKTMYTPSVSRMITLVLA